MTSAGFVPASSHFTNDKFATAEIGAAAGSPSFFIGSISSETSANVTLLQPNGKPVSVSRPQIKRLEGQRLSLMPEGLEMGLSSQQMADLLAFVLEGS